MDEAFRPTSAGKHSPVQLSMVIIVDHLLDSNLNRFRDSKCVISYTFYVSQQWKIGKQKNAWACRVHKGVCRMRPSPASIKRECSAFVNTERAKPSITKGESCQDLVTYLLGHLPNH